MSLLHFITQFYTYPTEEKIDVSFYHLFPTIYDYKIYLPVYR